MFASKQIVASVKIASLSAWQPLAARSPPDWRTSLGQIAVRIETDEGLIGYGVGGGGAAGVHVIRSVVGPLLIGRGVEPVELRWEEMYRATLPFGRATTYSEVARRIDRPSAARAVGAAVGRNPVSFVVPCHRVIGRSGGLTGYHWGLTRKRAILGWEAGIAAGQA